MLEVRYQNQFADLRTVMRVWSWPKRLFWSFALLWYLLACGLPPTLLLAGLDNWPAVSVGWGLLGLLAVLFQYKLWANQRASLRELEARLRPVTVRIGPEGFQSQSELGWCRCAWTVFERIVVRPQHIYAITSVDTVHIIPKSPFDSPQQADEFARAALDYQRNAGHSTVPFAISTSPPPAGDDVRQVTYRNLPAEFYTVQYEGLQQPGQQPAKKVTWRTWLTLALFGIALAWIASRLEVGHRALLGSLAFFILAMATLISIQWILRGFGRRNAEKLCRHERTVTVSPEGVWSVQADWEAFNHWQEFSSLEEDDRFIAVFEQNMSRIAHLIPKRAFANAEEADRFAAVARHHFERAHPPPAVAASFKDTGNPYQAPQAT